MIFLSDNGALLIRDGDTVRLAIDADDAELSVTVELDLPLWDELFEGEDK
jgi:hypothetical protein